VFAPGVRQRAESRVSRRLLVLEARRPVGEGAPFLEQLARMVAALHMSTVSGRFGWHRDGWQGQMRQDNCWETDGPVQRGRARPRHVGRRGHRPHAYRALPS
jgi:fructosamine-3-kinase